ncbi:FMN-binding protein [Aquimarina celericrescens]|uniref:FMN-binding protein n=1 Tax=Aquimarina celericrescens TaxID=1964542 RepID=A0ABW5ATQ8_9FLAO|nr:FMN-binding protein [Aquimarina celericrescens]
MKAISFLIILVFVSSCKQKSNTIISTAEESKKEIKTQGKVSSMVKELIEFAQITYNKDSDMNQLLQAKKIDTSGVVTDISLKKGGNMVKEVMKSGESQDAPFFEVANSNKIILLATSSGYSGPIWAKILIDKTTLEIQKVQFDHQSESEGYGADVVLSSFENKFTGSKISFTSNTFGLTQDKKMIIKGNQKIDGISGATITSEAVVRMLNNDLLTYKNYLVDQMNTKN